MRVTDFETGRSLNDVCLTLTHEEAEELGGYLARLKPPLVAVAQSPHASSDSHRAMRGGWGREAAA